MNVHRAKDGSVTYRVRIQRKGLPTQSASFSSRKAATQWSAMVETQIIEGRYFPQRKTQHTLGELIERYLSSVMPKKTPETQQTHRAPLQFWRDRLGHKLLAELARADVIHCRDELSDRAPSGVSLAPATICKYLSLLSGVLNLGVKELGWLDRNIMSTITRPSLPPGRTRFLTDEERSRLLAECKRS